MLEPLAIIERLTTLFATGSLSGKHVVITAGPTREAIDPVRYISNASSGKMGFALAEAAQEAGARVTLISGPVSLAKPDRVESFDVVSAKEMHALVMEKMTDCDIFLSVAAVADYHCKTIAPHKMTKTAETLTLTLTRNPDIVASVAALPERPFVIGFAAETEQLMEKANAKLIHKKLDMIIANQVGDKMVFDQDENTVIVITPNYQQEFPTMSKRHLARELIALIAKEVK